MESFELLKKYRILRGLTQKEVGEKLGMTQSGYAKLERGENKIDIDKLVNITSVLKVPFNSFNSNEEGDFQVEQMEAFYYLRLKDIADIFRGNNNMSENQKDIAKEIFVKAFNSIEQEKKIIKESLTEDKLEDAIKRFELEYLFDNKKK
jgi:transcriptional regulator with XRE-family HTH domain